MPTPSPEQRLEVLEKDVKRLREFNELLRQHLLKAQDFSGPGKGPTPQNVNVWLKSLSNVVFQKYRGKI